MVRSSVFSTSRFPLLAPLVMLALQSAWAETPVLPDVVVTASRLAQPEQEVIGDVSVLDADTLAKSPATNLLSALQTLPGIQLSRNGGAGKASAVFVRGTNGGHVLVLIDGVRWGSATVGAASLQHLPLAQVDRIEVLRGPAASLYGADALGGVIQVFTRQGDNVARQSVSLSAGNEGTQGLAASASGGEGATHYALGVAHERTDGHNVTASPSDANYYPDRDGYQNSSVSARIDHTLSASQSVALTLLAARHENHYDAAWYDPSYNALAQSFDYRETGKEGALGLQHRWQVGENWVSRLSAGVSIDDNTAFDPTSDTDYTAVESRFKTRQTQIGWQNELQVGSGTLTLGGESVAQVVSGTQAYAVDSRRMNGVQAGYLAQLDSLRVQLNLRRDHNSQFGGKTTGLLGLGWQFSPAWSLNATSSTGFKAPSFNDLYWPGQGNANLKPETSLNHEASLRWNGSGLQSSLTVYRNRVDDLIAWAPISPGSWIWQPSNVNQARLQGATWQVEGSSGMWSYGATADWLDARDTQTDKQLIRRAKRAGSLYASVQQGALNLRGELVAQGERFENAANTQILPGYALTNLAASYQLDKAWQLALKVNNLFAVEHVEAKAYRSTGRLALLTLSWQH